MINVKNAAIVGAVVATLVPAIVFARKRVNASNARKTLVRAKAAGRKVIHAAKARTAQKRGSHRAK